MDKELTLNTCNNNMRYFEADVFLEQRFYIDAADVHISFVDRAGDRYAIKDVVLEKIDPHVNDRVSDILVKRPALKRLMNQLWGMGIRPGDDVASTGQVQAMKNHIATLKERIVFMESVIDKVLNED